MVPFQCRSIFKINQEVIVFCFNFFQMLTYNFLDKRLQKVHYLTNARRYSFSDDICSVAGFGGRNFNS